MKLMDLGLYNKSSISLHKHLEYLGIVNFLFWTSELLASYLRYSLS